MEYSSTIKKNKLLAYCWWLMPVTLATWEADMGKNAVQAQPQQIVQETTPPK
jgi:hypothetical protein